MDKQVQTIAEEYANKNGMKLEYLDGDEFDTGPGQMRAFLAGHSLANDRIKELEGEKQGLIEAMKEVIRISDRKHDAWDKAKEAIKKATQ